MVGLTVLLCCTGYKRGVWSTFVQNKSQAVRKNGSMKWHYIPTKENPSDIGSREVHLDKLSSNCFKGPEWIASEEHWPS